MATKTKSVLSLIGSKLIYGGHITALGASFIVLAFIIFFQLPINWWALIIPYLISQVIYTYNHWRELPYDTDSNPERSKYVKENPPTRLLILYAILLLVATFTTNIGTGLLVAGSVAGGILYTEYLKELCSRYFAGLKSIYVAIFWATPIFFVPLFYQLPITGAHVLIYLFLLLHEIINTSFYDIKDIESDRKRNLKTFAVVLGKRSTLYILHLINIISLAIVVTGVFWNVLPHQSLVFVGAVIYDLLYLLIAFSLNTRSLRTLSYTAVDAEYIFWPLLMLAARFVL